MTSTRIPIFAGLTSLPVTIKSVDRPTGTFIQVCTPCQGITSAETVRVAFSPPSAREAAVQLLEESCIDGESAVLFVAERFGQTVELHPTLPTTTGSVIQIDEGFTGTPFKAVRYDLGWLRLTDRCPIQPPRRGWELLYLAPES